MIRDRFLQAFENILMVEEGSLTGDELLEELENWDSLAVVVVMAEAEQQYGTRVTGQEIARCERVSDLCRLISGVLAV